MNTSKSQEVNDRLGCITLLCGVDKSHASWDTNRNFPNSRGYRPHIICVKEKKQSLLFFPKFFATQKTFLNPNINRNKLGCLTGS